MTLENKKPDDSAKDKASPVQDKSPPRANQEPLKEKKPGTVSKENPEPEKLDQYKTESDDMDEKESGTIYKE